MLVTLTGDDSFGIRAALNQLVAAFVDTYGDMAVERLDGSEASFERVQESLQSVPFLAARKLVVLHTPSMSKQFIEKAAAVLPALPETTDVVLVEPKLDRRSQYYKYLKQTTDFRELAELGAQQLERWLVEAAEQANGRLSLADATFLVERVGTNQQLLNSELEKLILYDPKLTRTTIELLTDSIPLSNVFDLLEAAFAGKRSLALALYHDQREQKVDAARIIAMLAWQLRTLALVKTAGNRPAAAIAKEAGLNPFVVRRSQTTVERISSVRLRQLISDLLILDVRSKRENIDLDEALQQYLLMLPA